MKKSWKKVVAFGSAILLALESGLAGFAPRAMAEEAVQLPVPRYEFTFEEDTMEPNRKQYISEIRSAGMSCGTWLWMFLSRRALIL